MLDFLIIRTRVKKTTIEIYPSFSIYPESTDLMIRGGDFYAVWIEELGLWSTNEKDAFRMIDKELEQYTNEHADEYDSKGLTPIVCYMRNSESGMVDSWHKYCQKQLRDSYHMLDDNLIFSNVVTKKEDYATKKLPYPIEAGDISAYDRLISTLYAPEERAKIEWAIGSIISGDSKTIQKFLVLYGAAGTGKSTILNIIQQLFEGYYAVFDAKALGSSNNTFALEPFKQNPLVAIQHDGDLSRIEDNTRLNSLVSHETMTVNEKFKSSYSNRFKSFLFMGTNKPVKITDGKSGIIRRLIDVSPSGNKLNAKEYKAVMKKITFELGAIADHCLSVYLKEPDKYDDYTPITMIGATNDFYNFVVDSYSVFLREDGTTLKAAWEMYKTYCDEAKVPYLLSQRLFKEELKNYFYECHERATTENGRVRNYYQGFKTKMFDTEDEEEAKDEIKLIEFDCTESIFDKEYADCPAQYGNAKETPRKEWDKVTTKLSDLDTKKLHYVRVPDNHIVIDFDIKVDGKKSLERNIEEASKWPATYAELSKSGNAVHLHYIYSGDPTKLSRVYAKDIEIKVFTGKSSLRRKLTKCNNLPIAKISSGLPLKGDDEVIEFTVLKNEKAIRTLISKNLNKEYHANTKPSVDYIYKILEDAYASGMNYDVSDMRNSVVSFAASSSNQSEYCLKLVNKMKFKSDGESEGNTNEEAPIAFYDVEVFPNLFLVNWKFEGEGTPVVRMINPKPSEIEELMHCRLIGFNCRRYDNHILYARLLGYTNERLYDLSQRIISGDRNAFFGEAYNVSYTDVYDFAAKKQSLKKWEIELGIHHQELGLPWDQPVPEELWTKVAEYCDNDVIATEAVFNHLKGDWTARHILADLADGTVNDTTNSLTTRFIFGKDRNPQSKFFYRNLAEPIYEMPDDVIEFLTEIAPEMMAEPHGEAKSLLPYFPGYKFEHGKSTYLDEEIGEGGKVYAEPGMYVNVALLDITSMHPHSTMLEVLFGVEFTRRFYEIVYGRVHIKHEAWDIVNTMLDGKLAPYIEKVIAGEMRSKDLANALKIAINSVYGLTAASFDNAFRDPRNKDNIVAKRGALFMTDLKKAVQELGYTVAHIKTDSIKIPNATPEIIQFVMDFGKRYGYNFEHEATYEKMCLVNDAVYIAKYKDGEHAGEWTATGAQFAVPYVFKTLFSKEELEFDDLCETKSVSTSLYLDINEDLPEDQHDYHFVGKVGRFCPIKPGCNGGELVREGKDKEGNIKYSSATGAKGYRWLESEMVYSLGKRQDIDYSYFNKLVDNAVENISQYGDFEWFVSDEDLPWEE